MLEAWYRVVTPRAEVREGRSFNPDEFAIALEQVVSGKAPEDYRDPLQFFKRTCWTRALKDHCGMVLRRLSGETANTAPVLTLVTQFGGGKTHTLAALYHLTENREQSAKHDDVKQMLAEAGLTKIPQSKTAVFVGNAWDVQAGRETPWIDIARQLAGESGVALLGIDAKTTPPGTDALAKVFQAAGGPVLILCDEVLNFLNRYRSNRALCEGFHAFLQNLTVAMTGIPNCSAIISLPQSRVEMTDYDLEWQERINKIVRRVAKDLLANDEAEISEVVRRRLFENLGNERIRRAVSKAYADWCFDRRAQLPPEWTAVDAAVTDKNARDYLRARFEACYPFHPATLSVFQRKWQTVSSYQKTRGTLAMLAQWISLALHNGYSQARREPLLTLGSAPLEVTEFRTVMLGQLGEMRLEAAIESDIAGTMSHARALDADRKGALKNIHRRVASTILFESSGGMVNKVAHLPELRFALGEPDVETTSIDSAAQSLEARGFYLRKIGLDGFRFGFQPTLKKVVSDRRASLDKEEIRKAAEKVVKAEFEKSRDGFAFSFFPEDGAAIGDAPKLTIVVIAPEQAWSEDARNQISEWTQRRNGDTRSYPAALIWCVRKQGRELFEKMELSLAWSRVQDEIRQGALGAEFEASERQNVQQQLKEAQDSVREEVWASYRFVVLYDPKEANGLRVFDIGAGHATAGETMVARIIAALKSESVFNESVGAGYIERSWPQALRASGAWPLQGLRKSFLDGSLTRLPDVDRVLREKIIGFVSSGEFGLASGQNADGTYDRLWFKELVPADEMAFDSDVFLIKKDKAAALKAPKPEPAIAPQPTLPLEVEPGNGKQRRVEAPEPSPAPQTMRLRIEGAIPPESWNRIGSKMITKLRGANLQDLKLELKISASASEQDAKRIEQDLKQLLGELELNAGVKIWIE